MYRINKQKIQNHYYSCFHTEKHRKTMLVCYSKYMMYVLKNNTWFCTFDNFSLLYLKRIDVDKTYIALYLLYKIYTTNKYFNYGN
jgi:hypothetical protein